MTNANERLWLRRARELARESLPAVIGLFVRTVLDDRAPLALRLKAGSELLSRAGMPSQSSMSAEISAVGQDEIESIAKQLIAEVLEEQAKQAGESSVQ